MGLSSLKFVHWAPKDAFFSASESNRVRFGRSRSSKVDNFGTNRKRVCDFLLVCHCDYGPVLYGTVVARGRENVAKIGNF